MLNVQQPILYQPRTGPQAVAMPVPQQVVPVAQRGSLVPGQVLQIGKYSVAVERYLSEGGFAHVYLVRSSVPIMGTTLQVLKRVACANNEMLKEVGQEVQVMKLLRGHPNIVELHDASSEPMPDGSSVVYILMEFCSGGGIIDMMNRRLRERLTEAEILQVFVDVCEAVANMHALKPALLHRDLKVENILQSTPTSFKLCDFGSAAPVAPSPPSNTVQLRLLEADLNKHTTLQYRAPEMVDVYQRRPIDTKSDVWALGVLLYKLCYYTTPFESHGPIAIMNVSYKIPPYPVYSRDMNALIASMLRELGANRPSVFEVLTEVHRMRGTKSAFRYDLPAPLSPMKQFPPSAKSPPARAGTSSAISARDEVLAAVAPFSGERSVKSHISGPALRSRSMDIWEDASIGKKSDFAPKLAAEAKGGAVLAGNPSSTSPRKIGGRTLPPVLGVDQRKGDAPLFPERSVPTGNLISPPSSSSDVRRPPHLISIPSPSLSLPKNPSPLSALPAKSPAFLSPTDSVQSAEERFPSLEQLSSSFDQAFSPPSESARPDFTRGSSGTRAYFPASAQRTTESPKPLTSRPLDAPTGRPFSARAKSPSKPTISTPPAPSPNPVAARSTNVTGTAMKEHPTFSSVAGGSSLGPPRSGFAVGRPISAAPTVPVQSSPAVDSKPVLPQRAGPPLKRLEADFSKPKKKQKKRSAGDDSRLNQPLESSSRQEDAQPKDWLSGESFDDFNLSKPLESSKPLPDLGNAASTKVSAAAPSSTKRAPQSPAKKPLTLDNGAMQTASLRPSPSKPLSAPATEPFEFPGARTSAFKRHSAAVVSSGSTVNAFSYSAGGVRSPPIGRPTSTLYLSSGSGPGGPKPKEKPSFLRDVGKPDTTQSGTKKPDPLPKGTQNVSLSENWSPIEPTFPGGSPSSDEGPEEASGPAVGMRDRSSKPPQSPAAVPPPLKPKPTVVKTTSSMGSKADLPIKSPSRAPTSPNLMVFESSSGGAVAAADLPRSPVKPSPSPNLMDEENEEFPRSYAMSGTSSFPARQSAAVPSGPPPTQPPRPRPQSMFMSSSMVQTMSSLQVPQDNSPPVIAERRSGRRGSISEIVSKYEALQTPTLDSVAPPRSPSKEKLDGFDLSGGRTSPPKPSRGESYIRPTSTSPSKASAPSVGSSAPVRTEAALPLPSSSSSSSISRRRTLAHTPLQTTGDYTQYKSAAVRLPGLASTSRAPAQQASSRVAERSEESDVAPRALPGLAKSPSPAKPGYLSDRMNSTEVVPKAVSPAANVASTPFSRSGRPPPTFTSPYGYSSLTAPQPVSIPQRVEASPRPTAGQDSPPEAPFQGVGRLIDQWQKKAADSNKTERKPVTWQGKK